MLRPWSGQQETPQRNEMPEFDPNNPLCPGVKRGNVCNPNYKNTFVFTNDFPALVENVPNVPKSNDDLFQMSEAKGTCRVMCFHPKSNITLPQMDIDDIVKVIEE